MKATLKADRLIVSKGEYIVAVVIYSAKSFDNSCDPGATLAGVSRVEVHFGTSCCYWKRTEITLQVFDQYERPLAILTRGNFPGFEKLVEGGTG